MEEPTISVVVASHARHLRLRWLLNALEDQTLASDRWEVVLVHDYDAETAERVIERHPLATAGRARHTAIEPGTGSPAKQRNIGWRAARGRLVAFTDDDCRPTPEWLERLLEAAEASPGAVVQGATRPDPFEAGVGAGPHVRTMHIEPVGPYAQTCNILYPRDLLERLEGFDERAISGEDTGLSLRARAAGATVVPAPRALVYHAIESHTLPGILRQNLKWHHLAYLVKRHPEFRRELTLGVFFNFEHFAITLALAGLLGARRRRAALALVAPYAVRRFHQRAYAAGAVAALELPAQGFRSLAEVAGLAVGSVRHRTLLL